MKSLPIKVERFRLLLMGLSRDGNRARFPGKPMIIKPIKRPSKKELT